MASCYKWCRVTCSLHSASHCTGSPFIFESYIWLQLTPADPCLATKLRAPCTRAWGACLGTIPFITMCLAVHFLWRIPHTAPRASSFHPSCFLLFEHRMWGGSLTGEPCEPYRCEPGVAMGVWWAHGDKPGFFPSHSSFRVNFISEMPWLDWGHFFRPKHVFSFTSFINIKIFAQINTVN